MDTLGLFERKGCKKRERIHLTSVLVQIHFLDLLADISVQQSFATSSSVNVFFNFYNNATLYHFNLHTGLKVLRGLMVETNSEASTVGSSSQVFSIDVGKTSGNVSVFYKYFEKLVTKDNEIILTLSNKAICYEESCKIKILCTFPNTGNVVISPTHQLTILDDGTLEIDLEDGLKTDLILKFITNFEIKCLYEIDNLNQQYSGVVSIIPENEIKPMPCEFIFILDCSGSIHQDTFYEIKKAMLYAISSLPKDCYFNIINFGTVYKSLFIHSSKLNEETLKSARQYIKNSEPILGGSDIYQTLKHILQQEIIPQFFRQLILVTDGEISELQQVLDLIHTSGNVRIFTIGVNAMDDYTVRNLSFNGNGVVVKPPDVINGFISQLEFASQYCKENVELSWRFLKQYPMKIPMLFSGKSEIIYANLKEIPTELYALLDDGNKIPVQHTVLENTGILQRIVAEKEIQRLQDLERYSHYHIDVKNDLKNLSFAFNLNTNYTSFAVVDDTSVRGYIKNQLPEISLSSVCMPFDEKTDFVRKDGKNYFAKSLFSADSTIVEESLLDKIICLQRFFGSFEPDELFTNLFKLDEIQKNDEKFITALVIKYLEIVLKNEFHSWKLVAEKARNWLIEIQDVEILNTAEIYVEKLISKNVDHSGKLSI